MRNWVRTTEGWYSWIFEGGARRQQPLIHFEQIISISRHSQITHNPVKVSFPDDSAAFPAKIPEITDSAAGFCRRQKETILPQFCRGSYDRGLGYSRGSFFKKNLVRFSTLEQWCSTVWAVNIFKRNSSKWTLHKINIVKYNNRRTSIFKKWL